MKNNKSFIAVRAIASCAMLVAISIVLARLLSLSTPDGVRWSLDKFPLFLAGMLFGPVMGALTGFTADFLGSLMQYGFNPLLCLPAILYGLFGGIFSPYLRKKFTVVRLGFCYLFPIVLGSILYQSYMLAYLYFDGGLLAGLAYFLGTRSVQFAIMLVVEVAIIFTLVKLKIFTRLGLWNKRGNEE